MVGYRIVEIKNGKVMSLFHGTDGSRQIPLNQWNKATIKPVIDGSRGTTYTSGWHFLPTYEDAVNFFDKKFKIRENRYIIQCYVRSNIRPKEHSPKGVLLADEIKITDAQVAEALERNQ